MAAVATLASPNFAAALAADRTLLRSRLAALVRRPEVSEAIFLASPSLHAEIPLWLSTPDGERGLRVEKALVRYVMRMASRSTPFGLFAGCSTGNIDLKPGSRTRLHLEPASAYRRHTRIDMDHICALRSALTHDPARRGELRFYPNTSLYEAAGQHRYVTVARGDDAWSRRYGVAGVERTDYLDATLRRAEAGEQPLALAEALVRDDATVELEEARQFVDEVIDSQLLISELEPTVTGPEPLDEIVSQLRNLEAFRATHEVLEAALRGVKQLDDRGIGVGTDGYREIADTMASLPVKTDLRCLFQVDLYKPAPRAALGGAVLDEVLRSVEIFQRIGVPATDQLSSFKAAFAARYEARELPLLEVLDEESGIGLESGSARARGDVAPFLAGIPLGGPENPPGARANDPRDGILLGWLADCLRAGRNVLAVTEDDLRELTSPRPVAPLPDSCAALAYVAAASDEALDRGDFQVRVHGIVEGGVNPLGRFCHGDPLLHHHVTSHLRAEEALDPDAVFAEVVHLPEGRPGNIILRPALRAYEIPYLGRSGVPRERQILLRELMVSVVEDRVILRSRSLGKRVIPRMTNAHNVQASALGVYRFLRLIQVQGISSMLFWSWGAAGGAPFLPRVVTGRLVLARAQWRLDRKQSAALVMASGAARFRVAQELRRSLAWPRWIAVVEGDHELVIDLDNALAVDVLAEHVKKLPNVVLVEVFPDPEAFCARGPEGRFHHELLIPLLRQRAAIPALATVARAAPPLPERARAAAPGSDWLYVKIYAGAATIDSLLAEVIRPLVAEMTRAEAADHWFFIRYHDPDHHLRLRFHGPPERLTATVLPALHASIAPALDDGRAWRLQVDTYERELERYGGSLQTMQLAERLFFADSEAALSLVAAYGGDAGLDLRWQAAIVGIHRLLDDFGFDLGPRLALMERLAASFAARLGGQRSVRLQRWLGGKFRSHRARLIWLSSLLDRAEVERAGLWPASAAFETRSVRIAPLVTQLRGLVNDAVFVGLTESFIHMFVNRLMRSRANAFELVFYDLLARLYAARRAGAR